MRDYSCKLENPEEDEERECRCRPTCGCHSVESGFTEPWIPTQTQQSSAGNMKVEYRNRTWILERFQEV
jgi:hypothetical protein